jgi:preprotein translocase subunit SecG
MQTLIIVIHLMIVSAMIGVVLLQKSEGGGLGIGSTGGFMSNRGTANVLTRATAVLAGSFFATSLILSILASYGRHPTTILNPGGAPAGQSGTPPAQGQPATPGGLLDRLQQQEQPPAGGPPPQ